MPTGPINYRNLNYLRTAQKEDIKPHLIAECFDDVQTTVGSQQAQIVALQAQINALTAKTKTGS